LVLTVSGFAFGRIMKHKLSILHQRKHKPFTIY